MMVVDVFRRYLHRCPARADIALACEPETSCDPPEPAKADEIRNRQNLVVEAMLMSRSCCG